VIKGRPDYYITPTHDFTQYTRDSEEKYWRKETKFNWDQDVRNNLKEHLENLDPANFSRIVFLVLPMVEDNLNTKITQVKENGLPLLEDALKDIAECIPCDKKTINKALQIQSPLKSLQFSVAKMQDQLEILNTELRDMAEQQRLGFFRTGTLVKTLETAAEKEQQAFEMSKLSSEIGAVQKELTQVKEQYRTESEQLKAQTKKELDSIQSQVLTELEETRELLLKVIQANNLPADPNELSVLKDLVLKRQLRGLKDIANHALVVEQSAIAPLTMGIIHYKRHREIQEAMTTFINDEAKHSATFRRYLVEKLEAREFISAILIRGAGRYMWLARLMPGAGLFLAVLVEAIGAAYLEFFSKKEYMPDNLFRSICTTISEQDEKRHMDLCVAMYNEFYRKGRTWERARNNVALKVIMRSVYGDKTEDHHLIQAFRAFGVESGMLYNHIFNRLSQQLSRISMYVEPEKFFTIIGHR